MVNQAGYFDETMAILVIICLMERKKEKKINWALKKLGAYLSYIFWKHLKK